MGLALTDIETKHPVRTFAVNVKRPMDWLALGRTPAPACRGEQPEQ